MGVPTERAHGSIRFSLSRETTEAELDEAVEIIDASVARLRGSSSAALR
jgi:cysteine desulfurase